MKVYRYVLLPAFLILILRISSVNAQELITDPDKKAVTAGFAFAFGSDYGAGTRDSRNYNAGFKSGNDFLLGFTVSDNEIKWHHRPSYSITVGYFKRSNKYNEALPVPVLFGISYGVIDLPERVVQSAGIGIMLFKPFSFQDTYFVTPSIGSSFALAFNSGKNNVSFGYRLGLEQSIKIGNLVTAAGYNFLHTLQQFKTIHHLVYVGLGLIF
ncbi:MAG: hypothetical protein KDF60_09735 [Calditrichaeota bacterium]|nr:hypothetical protein [Calditrichota bacterium]